MKRAMIKREDGRIFCLKPKVFNLSIAFLRVQTLPTESLLCVSLNWTGLSFAWWRRGRRLLISSKTKFFLCCDTLCNSLIYVLRFLVDTAGSLQPLGLKAGQDTTREFSLNEQNKIGIRCSNSCNVLKGCVHSSASNSPVHRGLLSFPIFVPSGKLLCVVYSPRNRWK